MSKQSRLDPVRLRGLTQVVSNATAERKVAGAVALVSCGEDVHVEAHGVQDLADGRPMQRDTIFRIASMTKAIVTVVTLGLVEEAQLRLEDPVDPWLPELASRRVLERLDGPLDHTVPAERPITLRDLLTLRLGLGAIMAPKGTYPLQKAMEDAGVSPGPHPVPMTPDMYMKRLGELPLAHQPGAGWMYHTGYDILGVLLSRAMGMPLSELVRRRVTDPLGMKDTAFFVPPETIDRLATCYRGGPNGDLEVEDPARGGEYARAPQLESEMVSTLDDYHAFARMLLHDGVHQGRRILSRAAVDLMMTDQLTQAQKDASPFAPGFWDSNGWGMGGSVVTKRDSIAAAPGAYGWSGGFGTHFRVDRREGLVAIVLTQRTMSSPDDDAIGRDVITLAYHALA